MPTTETPDPVTEPDSPPHNRFFEWMRGLDLARQPGWLGGVCAGIAQRLDIDVVIVRGIVVVIGVLGGPVFLLYAAGWLLLPDLENRIHLERLFRGIFDRAMIGIVGIFILGLLPVTQGFWNLGSAYWDGGESAFAALGRALWTLLLVAAAIWLVVWLARRTNRSTTTIPATTDDRPDTIPNLPADLPTTLASEAPAAPPAQPAQPAQPAPGAPADELAAWREQQVAWKNEHDAWKRQQAASQRKLRMQRSAEARERTAANAVAAAERRQLRRLANPRMRGAHVAITLGAALLLGGIVTSAVSANDDWRGYEAVAGLGTATITVGAAIILAGAFRRRSGFLGFIAAVLLVATMATGAIPSDRQLLRPGGSVVLLAASGRYAQPLGSIYLDAKVKPGTVGKVIDIWQGVGDVSIWVPAGTTVLIEATIRRGAMQKTQYENDADGSPIAILESVRPTRQATGDGLYRTIVGRGTPDVTIRIWQGLGSVHVDAAKGAGQ